QATAQLDLTNPEPDLLGERLLLELDGGMAGIEAESDAWYRTFPQEPGRFFGGLEQACGLGLECKPPAGAQQVLGAARKVVSDLARIDTARAKAPRNRADRYEDARRCEHPEEVGETAG